MLAKLKRLNYRHVLPDMGIIALSFYASLLLRVGFDDLPHHLGVLNKHIFLFLILRIGTFTALGVYDIIWRYISLRDAVKLARGVLLSSLIIISVTYVIDIGRIPRATFFIDCILVSVMLSAIRFARRLVYEYSSGRRVALTGRKALIIGAGTNGRALVARLQTDNDSALCIVGFLDDDLEKVNRLIAGTRVLGTRSHLAEIISSFKVTEVIVAISRPPGDLLRHVVQVCRQAKIVPRLVTSLQAETGRARSLRDVELSDLLNRARKNVDITSIREMIRGRCVLVTGAGGSIGSELARQVLGFEPRQLLLLDHSEYNLYEIDRQLRGSAGDEPRVKPLMVDIKDRQSLAHVFKTYTPEIVFHAAAYKHVHLVEASPLTAILNNVAGTQNVLDLSVESGVETFVLISTDKAVNPVGVMGATKRVCELMVAQVGRELGKRYCAVRFGNVLGSSGSLIPALTRQIQKGEPITITHPDMTRYFMLVEEAVSLVLKAATIAQPGDITILDMGEPLRIVDIAKSLYALMGKMDEEAPIVFTGLRPGEKLFEELYICGNEIKTEHPGILMLPQGDGLPEGLLDSLEARIEQIVRMAREGKPAAVQALRLLVAEGTPNMGSAGASHPPETPFSSAKGTGARRGTLPA